MPTGTRHAHDNVTRCRRHADEHRHRPRPLHDAHARVEVSFDIGGSDVPASCAARIEKKLNRIEGVSATVNYATEKAKVTFVDSVTTD